MLKQNMKDAEERPARLKFEREIPSLYASDVAQAMWEEYKKTI